jgi:site-specific recombinase XerD
MSFTGIRKPEEFRVVTRAHVIAWRDDLTQHGLAGMTQRHRLAALSSLFEYLCERNAVTTTHVSGRLEVLRDQRTHRWMQEHVA